METRGRMGENQGQLTSTVRVLNRWGDGNRRGQMSAKGFCGETVARSRDAPQLSVPPEFRQTRLDDSSPEEIGPLRQLKTASARLTVPHGI
jgi:hypothetical protein